MTATTSAPAVKPPPPGPAVHLASGTRLCLFPGHSIQDSRAVSLPAADQVVGSSRWGKIPKRKQPLAGKEHPSSWRGSAAARPTLPGPTPTASLGAAALVPCRKEPVSQESWAPGGHSWAASLRNSEAQNLENECHTENNLQAPFQSFTRKTGVQPLRSPHPGLDDA